MNGKPEQKVLKKILDKISRFLDKLRQKMIELILAKESCF